MLVRIPCSSVTIVKQRRCWGTKRPYDVIRREAANYELAMVMGDLLVIHNEVAVFTANAIRLSALEKFGLCTRSPVSV